jgi:hypothetical protein
MENNKTHGDSPINTIEYNNNYISTGLTKREYFAAMALQGLLANDSGLITSKARDAVKAADALIEELNKTKQDA